MLQWSELLWILARTAHLQQLPEAVCRLPYWPKLSSCQVMGEATPVSAPNLAPAMAADGSITPFGYALIQPGNNYEVEQTSHNLHGITISSRLKASQVGWLCWCPFHAWTQLWQGMLAPESKSNTDRNMLSCFVLLCHPGEQAVPRVLSSAIWFQVLLLDTGFFISTFPFFPLTSACRICTRSHHNPF